MTIVYDAKSDVYICNIQGISCIGFDMTDAITGAYERFMADRQKK